MTKIIYEVVQHDGGWAYQVDGVFSETFPPHDVARRAADRAAKEQVVPGDATGISYEDMDGRWHDEASGQREVSFDLPEFYHNESRLFGVDT